MDRLHAPPPPGGAPAPHKEPLTPASEPELWPDEAPDEPIDEDWPSEAELGDKGWEEPEELTDAPEQAWPDDGPEGPGVELADEPDPELPSRGEDHWDREHAPPPLAERS
jgi:hypothetical protein